MLYFTRSYKVKNPNCLNYVAYSWCNYLDKMYPNASYCCMSMYDTKKSNINNSNLHLINVPEVWDITDAQGSPLSGKGITVAVIDSGINGFSDKIIDRYNFPESTEDISDSLGHGTIITNIVLQVAPGADLLGYKVGSDPSHVRAAIEKAVDNGAKIINLSIGIINKAFYNPSDLLIKAVEEAVRRNVVVVVGIGNDANKWGVLSPATSPSVISVGATTATGEDVTDYSNQGPVPETWEIKPDIVAPGEYQDDSEIVFGTSFAAPYVTGAIALIMQLHPAWTPDYIKSALATTATLLRKDGKIISPTAQGSGRIDVLKAIDTNAIFLPTHISYEPVSTESGENKQERYITIKNIHKIESEYVIRWDWLENSEGLVGDLNTPVITLQPSEEQKITLALTTKSVAQSGFYPGNVIITSGDKEWHLPSLAMVEPIEYPLLEDIKIIQINPYEYRIEFQTLFPKEVIKITILDPVQKSIFTDLVNFDQGRYFFTFDLNKLVVDHPIREGTYTIWLQVLAVPTSKYIKQRDYGMAVEIKGGGFSQFS